jgi:sugar lactone lactonase YvrE
MKTTNRNFVSLSKDGRRASTGTTGRRDTGAPSAARVNPHVYVWLVSLLVLGFVVATAASAQVKVSTIAGGATSDGKAGAAVAFQGPAGAWGDSKGNVYVADIRNHRLRVINSAGVTTTVAGTGIAGFSGDGGKAKAAKVSFPADVVLDGSGNILFSDSGNNRIRKISKTGIITTIVGTGVAGYTGDGGPATSAEINGPSGLALDSSGNLFFGDSQNQVVRKVDTAGNIHTVAGNGTRGFSGDGGPALSASMNSPYGVVTDSSGNLYIADHENRRVRVVNSSGVIDTLVGNGTAGCAGDGGPAKNSSLGRPTGVRISGDNLLISNACEARIRAVNLSTDIITTVVGSSKGFDGNGHAPLASQFLMPVGLTFDSSGNLVIIDTGNDQVRKLNNGTQLVKLVAGGFTGDGGKATLANINSPYDIAFDKAGNLYVAEPGANRIRKVTKTGTISTFAGSSAGISGYSGDGGPAGSATLQFPYGVAVDPTGNVFIADSGNNVIRKVDTGGTISTFASNAGFVGVTNLISDSGGNLYAADYFGCLVWRISSAGAVSLLAGVQGVCGYNGDGIKATQAQLNSPWGLALDSKGNLYIADSLNNRVREVNTSGVISTIAGTGACGFSGDGGGATSAKLCGPAGLALDTKGNFYIGDYGNFRVRTVNSAGTISTFAGTGKRGYNGDGLLGLQTNIDGPAGFAVTSNIVYMVDNTQCRVRKIH